MTDAPDPSDAPAQDDDPQRLWGGRFDDSPDELMASYTASINVDLLLYQQDIEGSRAHVRMLARRKIIDQQDADKILAGLDQVEAEIDEGTLEIRIELEDIHTHVEARLAEIIGPDAAGRLHTGRSRNDQVALDTRMFVRDAEVRTIASIQALQISLIDIAERNIDIYMPGYTHLQRAQPVLLAHHLMAYVEMLDRDAERFIDAVSRADIMPLGSAALAGAAYPLDREWVAEQLGFEQISRNSMDAVSSRDYILEFLAHAAICMVNISRLSEDLILWSSSEFGILRLDDAFTTGSSIMPQKRNPDLAELARGKTGRAIGYLTAVLATVKGLPLAYNRDLQEDKESLMGAAEVLFGTLQMLARALLTAQFDGKRARAMVDDDPFILATDYADYLTRGGAPFREAHRVVGELVRLCEASGRGLRELSLDELRAAHPGFGRDAVGMTVRDALAARDLPGGTAPRRVRQAIKEAKEHLQLVKMADER